MSYFPPTGSVVAYQSLPSSLLTGASIIGRPPVAVTNIPSISGTVDIGIIPGSVLSQQMGTRISSVINSAPSSLLTGASIFGMIPAGSPVIGSVAVLQGTSPWLISSVYGNISGSVLAQQSGTRITSVVGSIPSSLLTGTYGHRNDAVASFLGGNLTWNPLATDSAGRTLTKPFAPDENVWTYQGSVVSGSVTLMRASAIGLRQHLTDFWLVNSGSVATLITWRDGSTSVLGYAVAPAGTGANSPGINVPLKTARSQDLTFSQSPSASILYLTATGYQAP